MVGLFLGQQLDENIVRFVILYGDDPLALFERPITVGLALLSLGLLAHQVWTALRRPRAEPAA